jgi:hypothetical protein
MIKRVVAAGAILAAMLAGACTTSNTKVASTLPEPLQPGARVVVIQPDVKLSIVTAAGAPERRADWSEAGERNVLAAVSALVAEKGFQAAVVDPDAAGMSRRAGQITRLHEQVAGSIIVHHLSGLYPLPSMQGRFDYTLGNGVQELVGGGEPGYAMFVTGEGCFSSGGRMAVVMLAAVAGASLPTCTQQLMVSLVRTDTGQVVWFNYAVAGPADDMREEAGARTLVQSALRTAPLTAATAR